MAKLLVRKDRALAILAYGAPGKKEGEMVKKDELMFLAVDTFLFLIYFY